MKTLQLLSLFIFHYAFIYCQNVGIGTATPKVKLHVLKGVQTVAPSNGSTMAVQSDGETFLQILSNDLADQNGIIFGHTTQPNSAGITFNFSGSRELAFFTNASAPSLILNNQGKVGIGTISPVARLQVADSNVLFTGPATVPGSTLFNPPIQGPGTRMMWYPQRAAFRVGSVDGTQWDKNNIGRNSFAAGSGNIASANAAIAIGNATLASGISSTATGNATRASGTFSTAMGGYTVASGVNSMATGNRTTAKSFSEITIGSFNTDYTPLSAIEWRDADRLFVVGNGNYVDQTSTPGDALVILKNGNTGLGSSMPAARLHVADSNVLFTGPAILPFSTTYNPPAQGAGTRLMWYPQKAAFRAGGAIGNEWDKSNIGLYSFASGFNVKAVGDASFASGGGNSAIGYASTAMGEGSVATGEISVAIGNSVQATGTSSFATGNQTIASGSASFAAGNESRANGAVSVGIGYSAIAESDLSVAIGSILTANAYGSIVLGRLNDPIVSSPTTSWVPEEPLLIVGNGTQSNFSYNYSNALVILKNGNTGIGISAPHAPLQLASTLSNRKIVLYEVADNEHQFQGFGMNFGVLRYQVNKTGDDHVFYAGTSATTSNELMRIKGNGNVGINSNTPAAKLQVSGSLLVDGTQPTHTGQGAYLEWNRDGGSGKTFILNQKGIGPGGIVFGDIDNTNYMVEHLRLDYNGNATLAGVLTQNSDERLKTNIHPLSSSLQNLQQLNGYTYNWADKNRDNDLQVGVLAQEVQKIYPQLVKTAADGTLSVNYSGFVPVLIEGMKEQQKQIEELKQLVKTLTNK